MPGILKRLPERVLEGLQTVVLVVIYVLVALPIGLLWRLCSPHASWKKAERTRWETPDAGRKTGSLERAEKQF